MTALLLVLLLSPFVSAPLLLLLGQRLGSRVGWAALVAPLLGFGATLGLYLHQPDVRQAAQVWEWIPRLGVNLSFTPDGLALFFGLLVTGVGLLVTFYATHYLDDSYKKHGQFYCVLQLFMGAMLVTVFSGNLLVLFTAWELTGITSFFLIGFLSEQAESRRGARMALVTTVTTGLGLLVGIVLLHQVFGTFDLREIVGAPVPAGKEGLLLAAFLCSFLGIAGKSALFPFQYWLPNAMAAPTPVSAYLHSATMVKLGVFLTARMLPIFGGLDAWAPTLTSIGFFTFLLGAFLAWRSHDLKAVLAYTTVAQLGVLVGQYGWSTQTGVVFGDILHILNHTLYKACLFMVVGIIDHSTGTRDLRKLGGLFGKMPLTGVVALVALASMAGLPLTAGFISKELLLEGGLAFRSGSSSLLGTWPLVALVAGSLLHALIALRIARRVFFGTPTKEVEAHFHGPSLGIQLPPFLLSLGILYFGLQPDVFGHFTAYFSLASDAPHLALWHGFTPVAMLSLAIFATAGIVFVWTERRGGVVQPVPSFLQFDRGFDRAVDGIPTAGKWVDRAFGFVRPSGYLLIIVGVLGASMVAGLVYAGLGGGEGLAGAFANTEVLSPSFEGFARWALVIVMSIAALLAAVWQRPIQQLFAISVVGFGIAFYYILYRAPDLALTQLLVESATLLLVLLVVLRFKRDGAEKQPIAEAGSLSHLLRVVASAGFGILLGLGVLIFRNDGIERAGEFYVDQTLPLAKGANAVNTVVVDFRGFDTLLEITVLLIAALGVLGLLTRSTTKPAPVGDGPAKNLFLIPRDFILKSVAVGGFIPLNLFSVYIFFRGHDAPGGGFVAGLITALTLVLLAFVFGVDGTRRKLRVMPIRLAVAGIFFAVGTATFPILLGHSPLHHIYVSVGSLTLGTPMIFDLGVYLTVVGVTLKLMLPLMNSVHGLPAFAREEAAAFAARGSEPIDVGPGREPEGQLPLSPMKKPSRNGSPEKNPAVKNPSSHDLQKVSGS